MNKLKLGIMGGTFDPIHDGHIKTAYEAYKRFNLDIVLFIPTGVSFFKTGVSDASIRYEMTCKAVEGYDWAVVSDCEIQRSGNTYTKDTIDYLKDKYDDPELFFITGSDTIPTLEKWYEFEYVLSNLHFIVTNRTDKGNGASVKKEYTGNLSNLHSLKELREYYINKYNAVIDIMDIDPIEVSSSAVRDAFNTNNTELIDKLLIPSVVKEYIIEKGLYKNA